MPFPGRVPAVAARRGARAGAGVEHVPDERLSGARVFALDGDAEALAPAGHGALRTGGRQRLDDRLDDLLAAMAGAERDRRAFVGPHDGALFGDHLDRPEGSAVLRRVGIDQEGDRHADGGPGVGVGGIDEAGHLRIGVRQIDHEIAAPFGDLGVDADILVAAAVVVEQRQAFIDAFLPFGENRAGLPLGGVEDGFDGA